MRKLIILVRHPESSKNVIARFSSAQGEECVTQRGEEQISHLSECLRRLALENNLTKCCAVCSDSDRTKVTGTTLASALQAIVVQDPDLGPISGGAVAGIEEAKACIIAPDFMHSLELYRAGVFNSYDLEGYGENVG